MAQSVGCGRWWCRCTAPSVGELLGQLHEVTTKMHAANQRARMAEAKLQDFEGWHGRRDLKATIKAAITETEHSLVDLRGPPARYKLVSALRNAHDRLQEALMWAEKGASK